jgi:hypothetical protein
MEGTDDSEVFWTSGAQSLPVTDTEAAYGLTKFGLGVGAIGLLGRTKLASGGRVWDKYMTAVRGFEEYSPARMGRTFQISHMMSPWETASRQSRYLSPDIIRQMRSTTGGTTWIENVERLIGRDIRGDLLDQGFRFEGGQLLSGRTGGEVLLKHAGIIRSPMGVTPTFQEGYFRSLANGPVRGLRSSLTSKVAFEGAEGIQSEVFSIAGGRSRTQAAGRFLGGVGTSFVERFNRLIQQPAEILPGYLGKLAGKIGSVLTVEPSSGLKTLGKLSLKLGVGLPAAYMAYDLADWGLRQLGTAGITGAAANIITGANMMASQAAEYTGGHALREWQEGVAPGSTEMSKLLAFPFMGAFGGAAINYARNVAKQAAYRKGGYDLAAASTMVQAEKHFMIQSLYGTEIPENISKMMTPDTIGMVQGQVEVAMKGLQGRMAKRIASTQSRGGLLGMASRLLGKATPTKLKSIVGGVIGLGLVAPFIPGAMVPSERPEELEKIYSGEQLVPIRRGRWWEMGRSAWEGGRVDRFVPNWNVRLQSNVRDIGVYGEDLPAIAKFWKQNFTYDVEERNYWTRPYPITGTAFEDVPLIGPLLAPTLGQLVKPAKLMHTEESYGPGGSIREMPMRFGERGAISSLGEQGSGSPINPYGIKGTISEFTYRMQEMVGLPGFTLGAIKQATTGTEGFFDQEQRLQSASEMYSTSRDFYEEELGGMGMTNEAFRRLFPRDRKTPVWNAIPNAFKDIYWLPGEGDRSPNFKVGDPYRAIEHGEFRLPGPGYDILHPELAGVDPNMWPTVAKYRMLADVAPYSEEHKKIKGQITSMKRAGHLGPEEVAEVAEIERQTAEKKTGKRFHDYKYRDSVLAPAQEMLEAANEFAKSDQKPGFLGTALGSYWETLSHNAETPFEFLTPISPGSKFVHMRTAIEDYEKTQVYGSEQSFWQAPVRDFFRPFGEAAAHAAGWEGIPDHIKQRRDVEDYFDMLKYIKMTKLKGMAAQSGDAEAFAEFEQKRRETLTGVNPYTQQYTQIFRALPRRDRDYFNDFAAADLGDQAKILKMVPENEKALYLARWQQANVAAIKSAEKKGLMSDSQISQANDEVKAMYENADAEGMPKSTETWAEYQATRVKGESYGDWYRRTKLLPQKLSGKGLPGPDWVGWNPAVSLDDIKLKVVENLGDSPYEYDIWPDQQRQAARRPYLEQAAQDLQSTMDSPGEVRSRIQSLLTANNVRADMITVTPLAGAQENTVNIDIHEDRSNDVREVIRRQGLR